MTLASMRETPRFGLLLLAALLWLGYAARATTFLTLQSTYLGDGWFQYQMNVADDPFFLEADITGLDIHFTNQIDQVNGGNGWSYQGTNEWNSQWAFSNNIPSRPYSETFLIRSSETSWRMGTWTNADGAVITFSLYLSGFAPPLDGVGSVNVVGYALMPCLIPCDPADADGSPTNFVYVLKLIPDVSLNGLVQTNGNIYGIDFTWDSASTFLLQGSPNLSTWTNVTYLWSYPPETIWTTNTPLNNYGNFFRIELVADGYATNNLPPLNSAGTFQSGSKAAVSLATPRVMSCRPANGKIAVTVATQPGQAVLVQAMGPHGTIFQAQQVVAQGSSVTVSFDATTLPSPVFFQATLVP